MQDQVKKRKRIKGRKFSREQAIRLIRMGFSQKEVADLLGVHKSTLNKFVLENNIQALDQSVSIGAHLKDRLNSNQLAIIYAHISPEKDIVDLFIDTFMSNLKKKANK